MFVFNSLYFFALILARMATAIGFKVKQSTKSGLLSYLIRAVLWIITFIIIVVTTLVTVTGGIRR